MGQLWACSHVPQAQDEHRYIDGTTTCAAHTLINEIATSLPAVLVLISPAMMLNVTQQPMLYQQLHELVHPLMEQPSILDWSSLHADSMQLEHTANQSYLHPVQVQTIHRCWASHQQCAPGAPAQQAQEAGSTDLTMVRVRNRSGNPCCGHIAFTSSSCMRHHPLLPCTLLEVEWRDHNGLSQLMSICYSRGSHCRLLK
jgi:hypothetical protein